MNKSYSRVTPDSYFFRVENEKKYRSYITLENSTLESTEHLISIQFTETFEYFDYSSIIPFPLLPSLIPSSSYISQTMNKQTRLYSVQHNFKYLVINLKKKKNEADTVIFPRNEIHDG